MTTKRRRRTGRRRCAWRAATLLLLLLLLLSAAFPAIFVRAVRRFDGPISAKDHHRNNERSGSANNGDIDGDSVGDGGLHGRRLRSAVDVEVPDDPDGHLVDGDMPLWKGNPGDGYEKFPTRHWAGHLPASEDGEKYLFYWLFAPDLSDSTNAAASIDERDVPVVIWLNGGPACSSMDGLFLENGPFRLVKDSETDQYVLTAAEHSWHRAPAYTLYIDQPVGTGLSFTTSRQYPKNDVEVNVDFYYFLQQFLKLHSDKFVDASDNAFNRELYFSGESHAGHYIPSMMNYILKQNEDLSPGQIKIPLAGAAIGNGWVEPYYQYAAAEAAYGHGLLGRAQWHALDEKEKQCQKNLASGKYTSPVCYHLLDDIVAQSQGADSKFKVSTYDARRSEPKGAPRTFPPGHKVVETYLGGHDLAGGGMSSDVYVQVLEAIHATAATEAGQVYMECTDPPYNALAHQDGLGVTQDVVDILEYGDDEKNEKIRLLFFNGIEDLICNHVGNEKVLENLPWSGKEDWIKGSRYAWISQYEEPGKVSGYMKEHENLMFLKLMDSGHMVPLDIPDKALDMIRILMHEGSFETSPQKLPNAVSSGGDSCPLCPTCDECEVCPPVDDRTTPADAPGPGDDDDTPTADSEDSSKLPSSGAQLPTSGAGMIAGVVLAAAAAALLVVVLYRWRRRKPSRNLVPQYDLELRSGTYTDAPEAATSTNGIT